MRDLGFYEVFLRDRKGGKKKKLYMKNLGGKAKPPGLFAFSCPVKVRGWEEEKERED